MAASRDLRAAAFTIFTLSLLGWLFLLWTAHNMDAPIVRLMMPMSPAWTGAEAFWIWAMWAVMMGAMMLPSAAPMILTHRKIAARRADAGGAPLFALAYLAVWAGFSVAAALAQWGLQTLGVLTPMLVLKGTWFPGAILVFAGVVQWTPLKQRCLALCRTPIGFLTTEWRPGRLGAFRMGAKHGAYCLGCCWALMALLFAFGAMNLSAITALATLVAAEKLLPKGEVIARIGGAGFIVWGMWLIAG